MKIFFIVTILAAIFAYALGAHPKDANDGCTAECQAVKGGYGMGISSVGCPDVTGKYCADNCQCNATGTMACVNSNGLKILDSQLKCSDDAITKTCVQGIAKQWECWCQDILSWDWGPSQTCPGASK